MNNFFLDNASATKQQSLWGRTITNSLRLGVVALSSALAITLPAQACLNETEDFTFVPEGDSLSVTSAYPRVFWQLPENEAQNLQISVTDDNFQELYFWDYKLSQGSTTLREGFDLMSVQAPESLASVPFEPDTVQNWKLTLICDFGDRTQDLVIQQKIKHVSIPADIQAELSDLTAFELIDWYLDRGLINSALSTFFTWQRDLPPGSLTKLEEEWAGFQRKAGIIEVSENQ